MTKQLLRLFSIIPLNDAQQHWLEFLLVMTSREIKARYKHAVLGFLWVLLNPLLQMLIMGFVFRFFVPVEVDNYFLFLFTGLLPWMFFSLSVTKATPSIVHERGLIQKAKFPREIIVLAIVLSNLFHFLVSLLLLVVLLIGDKIFFESYSFIEIFLYAFRILGVIPLSLWLAVLTSGISLFTSALNVRFRDINFIIQAIIPLWFYATPIVYTLGLLPEKLYPIFYMNPVSAIIEGFHYVLLFQNPAEPDLALISLVVSSLVLYIGIWTFNEEKKWFSDWF